MLVFSDFLENCDDVISFVKNSKQGKRARFRIEYKIRRVYATYYPDFFEKGRENCSYYSKRKRKRTDKLKFETAKVV